MVTDVKFRLSIEGVDPVVSGFDRIRGKTGQVTAEMNGTTRSFTSYGMAAIVAEQQTRKLGDAQDALSQRAAKSSKELSFALRGLPAQFTDIFTSLQAGQNPLTVLLQQGGQLKDMFGGIGPAAKAMGGYILGLINPFTVAAGVALTLALAYHQGAQESKAYERAIILSGNAAGTTTQQLQLMAIGISAVSGTQGAAASALASMAQSGQVAGKNLEYFSSVALKMEKSVGQPVADTVKQFADLARAPVDASVKLNEQIHYLTASVYEQIKALEESGRTQEAGELAQSAYAKAMDARTKKLTDNMGSIERGWKSVAGAAKWAWDSMLGIGREQDVATRMQGLNEQINKIDQLKPGSYAAASQAPLREAMMKQLGLLQSQGIAATVVAEAEAKTSKEVEAQVAWGKIADQFQSKKAKMAQEIARAEKLGLEAGRSRADIEAVIAQIQEKNKDHRAASAITKEISAYASLTAAIKAKTAENEAELAADARLTEGQKLRIKLDKDLAAGKLVLTAAHKAEAYALSDANLASEQALKLREAERAVAKYIAEGTLARKDNAAQLAVEYAMYGKTSDAREYAMVAIKEQTVLERFLLKEKEAGIVISQAQIDQLNEESAARVKVQQATLAQSKALGYAKQLHDENERFAADSLLNEKDRARAVLQIDAKVWEERIELAGAGTEAQKQLQTEYMQWYANQLGKSTIDETRKSVEKYDQLFSEGFADMLNGGKATWKSFTTSLATTFKTSVADQIYKMFAQPFVVKFVASMVGLTGNGLANATGLAGDGAAGGIGGAMSLVNTAKSIYSAFTGGFAAAGAGIQNLGVELGSQFVADFGYGFGGGAAGGNTAAALGGAAGIAAGVGGGIFGGRMISDGYSAWGKSGNSAVNTGTAVGAIVGSIVPVIGTALGALVGGLLGGVANRAFGMRPKEFKDTSIVGNFVDGGFGGYTETPWKQKGGWFRSDKSGIQRGEVDTDFANGLTTAFGLLKVGAGALATSIGVSTEALSTYSHQFRITLTDDAEANNQLLEATLNEVGDGIVKTLIPTISALGKEGETSTQTLERLSGSLTTANAWLSVLGQRLFQVSLAGADSASKLADVFGGLDNLTKASDAYYRLYYTDGERAATSLRHMRDALSGMNIAMPGTMVELRNMVDALDLNTDSGRAAYAALMTLAPEFASSVEAIQRAAQDAATSLLAAATGRGQLMGALDMMALKTRLLDGALDTTADTTGNISTLFLDANSGLITFGMSTAVLSGELTGAQVASQLLNGQILSLRMGSEGAAIDIGGLTNALASVNTETFVATLALVFENLAERISGIIGDIATERMAVREAALQIINPTVMTKAALERAIAEANVSLPSNSGVVTAQGKLTAADATLAQRQATQTSAKAKYDAAVNAANTTASKVAAQAAKAEQRVRDVYNANYNVSGTYGLGSLLNGEVTSQNVSVRSVHTGIEVGSTNSLRAALIELEKARAAQATQASNAASVQSNLNALLANYNNAVAATAAAQTAANTAVTDVKKAQLAYTDALQNFAIDAGNSVTKLGKLREETLKYYEAQKALANLMGNSAAGLRSTVDTYRYGQMSTEQQFNQLQTDYAQSYAMALSTDGEALAGYGDKMNGTLNELLEKAREYYGSDAEYNVFANTAIARAEAIAARLEEMAPDTYQADSLDLLGQIDSTLAALDESSRSAEQLIVNAINGGRDATVDGLRQITNALTGKPVAAFASGGDHVGGWRIVGERGPELEATGASRIFNAVQTRALMSGGGGGGDRALTAEIRALRAEVIGLRIEARATASYTAKLARQGERNEIDGVLVRTDLDTPLQVVSA